MRALLQLCTLLVLLSLAAFGYSIRNVEGDISSLVTTNVQGDTFSFAVLGDSRSGIEICEKIMKLIRKEKPAFAVFEGDFVPDNTEADYRFFMKLAESGTKRKYPLFMVAGNHDIKDPDGNKSLDRFQEYFGKPYYRFTYKNVLFITLNNADGKIDEQQMKWFEEVLKSDRAKYKHCFVFMHIPPFDYRPGISHDMHPESARQLMALFEQYGVTALFASHIHSYHKEERNGVTYIITGGAGARLHEDPAGAFYHYVMVQVNGDSFDIKVVPVSAVRSLEDRMEYFWEVRYQHYLPHIAVGVALLTVGVVFGFTRAKKRARRGSHSVQQ